MEGGRPTAATKVVPPLVESRTLTTVTDTPDPTPSTRLLIHEWAFATPGGLGHQAPTADCDCARSVGYRYISFRSWSDPDAKPVP